jgi:hypothetical protein
MVAINPQARESKGALDVLIGNPLTSVAFTMDYLQLMFDSRILNVLTDPTVWANNKSFEWGGPGFRDQICSFIQRNVESAEIFDSEVVISFGDHDKIVMPLTGARPGNEALYFFAHEHWFVLHQI